MDAETQARQDFLEESIEYCDQLESALLGITEVGVDLQKLDEAARAAHSVKGGAAMMGFNALSRTAHALEDYLKIIQARFQTLDINAELETLLLQAVDCLRAIGKDYRAGKEPQQEWLNQQTRGLFWLRGVKCDDRNILHHCSLWIFILIFCWIYRMLPFLLVNK